MSNGLKERYQPTAAELQFASAAAAERGLLSPSEQWAQEQLMYKAQQAADAAPGDAKAQERVQLVSEIARLAYRDNGGEISNYTIDGFLPTGTHVKGIGHLGEETSVHLEAQIHNFPMSPVSAVGAVGNEGSIGGGSRAEYRGKLGTESLGYYQRIDFAARYGKILRERRDLAAEAPVNVKVPLLLPPKK